MTTVTIWLLLWVGIPPVRLEMFATEKDCADVALVLNAPYVVPRIKDQKMPYLCAKANIAAIRAGGE